MESSIHRDSRVRVMVTIGPDREALLLLAGEIDIHSVPRLREHLLSVAAGVEGRIRVDLELVRWLDSSGVAVLIELIRSARRQGISIELVNAAPVVTETLNLFRLEELVRDPRAAVRAARGREAV